MPNKTFYEALEENQFVEKLYQTSAQEYWGKAIATLKQFWAELISDNKYGILFTNSPQIISSGLYADLSDQTWFFTSSSVFLSPPTFLSARETYLVKLDPIDTCTNKWFLISITAKFATLFISSEHKFLFSLHPQPISLALKLLKQFISDPLQIKILNQKLHSFTLVVPTYEIMSKFVLVLLTQAFQQELPIPEIKEVDMIMAIAHEVKTPLTTIRTLVQSILRRQDINQQVRYRLEKIDFECQDQIARFNLIFEIVKLEQKAVSIEPTNLTQIFKNSIDHWQKQAQRYQLTLKVEMINYIPIIFSNEKLLIQLLNNIIDRLTRNLPADSQISIEITLAGEYVKLKFKSQTEIIENKPTHKNIGKWLMLQPETGALSLNLMISKILFELIGGKLTIKLHPTLAMYDEEILTVFLPIQD